MPSKKSQVIEELFAYCFGKFENSHNEQDLLFDNALVKRISVSKGFGNAFDVTKIDNTSKLPTTLRRNDFFIVHIGSGIHKFARGISYGYHDFEGIQNEEKIDWTYRRSILNDLDTSEASILSLAANQKIINDFLYSDITKNPKVYNSRRTKVDLSYKIGPNDISTNKLQIEIDLTMENEGEVTVFEGKNGFPSNFAVYQLFHPYAYFSKLNREKNLNISRIACCYVLRRKVRGLSTLRLYKYDFTDCESLNSIHLIKKAEYRLLTR